MGRNVSFYRRSPNALVHNSYKSMKQFVKFIIGSQRSGGACNPLPSFFSCRKWMCTESFEKLSTAQLTCSEGALFQYMVMRNGQLTGLYREDVHNIGGGGEEGRQYNAANDTELFVLHRHGQFNKKLNVYRETGSVLLRGPGHRIDMNTRKKQ